MLHTALLVVAFLILNLYKMVILMQILSNHATLVSVLLGVYRVSFKTRKSVISRSFGVYSRKHFIWPDREMYYAQFDI